MVSVPVPTFPTFEKLRFWFQFRFWQVTVPVPASYIDHKKHSLKKRKNLAFLHCKLFYKEFDKFHQIYCKMLTKKIKYTILVCVCVNFFDSILLKFRFRWWCISCWRNFSQLLFICVRSRLASWVEVHQLITTLERFLSNSYLPQVETDLVGGGASAAHHPG